jgi:hypothetical protein
MTTRVCGDVFPVTAGVFRKRELARSSPNLKEMRLGQREATTESRWDWLLFLRHVARGQMISSPKAREMRRGES